MCRFLEVESSRGREGKLQCPEAGECSSYIKKVSTAGAQWVKGGESEGWWELDHVRSGKQTMERIWDCYYCFVTWEVIRVLGKE